VVCACDEEGREGAARIAMGREGYGYEGQGQALFVWCVFSVFVFVWGLFCFVRALRRLKSGTTHTRRAL
jgi:hypothetical protein